MANHFNDLLLQTLKEINVRLDRVDSRLDRVDGRIDRLIETKADKTDIDLLHEKLDAKADQASLDATNEKLDSLNEKVDTLGEQFGEKLDTLGEQFRHLSSRIDRIAAGIGTLKWVIGAEVAVIGVILAFIKAC